MRTFGSVILSWLHTVALSVWLGGVLVLGAVTAPAVFGSARRAGDVQRGMPLYDFAGSVMTEAFRRFNTLVLVAGLLMLLAGLGYGLLAGICRKRLLVRAALTGIAWGIAAWSLFSLFPQMMDAQAAGRMDAFDAVHETYSTGFEAQVLLLLGVAALTGWLHLDRTPHSTAESEHSPSRTSAGSARGAEGT